MTDEELHARLVAIREAEIATGCETFLGVPERYFREGPLFRCRNDHVSSRILKSEEEGDLCLACFQKVWMTFPEDRDGPLR